MQNMIISETIRNEHRIRRGWEHRQKTEVVEDEKKWIAFRDAAILEEIDRGFEVTYAAADPTPDKLFTDVYIHYEGRLQ